MECLDDVLPTVTDIINQSLSSDIVPQHFKHAIVKPLLKKTNLDPEDLKNYRPISNLPFLSKVLERIVLLQLLDHLKYHNLLEPFQSAYRKGHSTETALLRVVNDLFQACDIGHISILSLLDLSAAFDTIDHETLQQRMYHSFGLDGVVLKWFVSYLSGRTQSVLVGETESSKTLLRYGVPQGSVLGPVLYTMYMYPLGTIIKESGASYHFYADDTQLYDHASPSDFVSLAQTMNKSISSTAAWMKTNKLKLNDSKTEILLTGTKTKLLHTPITPLTIGNVTIPFSEHVRNLGVFLDSNLSFDIHINNVCKALYIQIRRLHQIRPYITSTAANKLAVSFILSRLDYCNSLLAGLPDNKLQKFQKIQNSAARVVLRKSKKEHTKELLKTLHWLPVKARVVFKISSLCYQCLHTESTPSYLRDLIHPYNPPRSLRSKDAHLLTVPRYSLDSQGKRSFCTSGPLIWNSLPLYIRQSPTHDSFKKQLKTHLFETYLL